jgi:carbonic anhydrase
MKTKLLLIFAFSVFLLSCSSQPPVPEQSVQTPPVAQESKKDIWSWDYSAGERGPENWAQLNPQYEMCGSGISQSPINLIWHKPSSPNPLKINYKEGNATMMNTGYTLRVELTPQSSLSFNGVDYLLEKIEIRSPSEHTLSGNQLPMEFQFYHRSSNGLKQAIISLFVIKGRGSAWFDSLWEKTQNLQKFKSSAPFRFNPEMLMPPRQTYYQYEGSLTHPPCLEGVQWFVFNTPLQLSQQQIDIFRGAFQQNNRPVQPLNGRQIRNY